MSRLLRAGRLSLYVSRRARVGVYRHVRSAGTVKVRRETGLPPEVERQLGVGWEEVPGPERLFYTALRLGWMELQWRARPRGG